MAIDPQGHFGLCHGVDHGYDPVDSGVVQHSDQGWLTAGHGDIATTLAGVSDPADQCSQSCRVHKRDPGQVDDKMGAGCRVNQRLAELRDGEGVQLTDGTANRDARRYLVRRGGGACRLVVKSL